MKFLLTFLACLFSLSLNALEIKKAKIGDIEIAYYMRGSGQPLVMINGFKSTLAAWDPSLLEHLEKNYQLILFDNRGSGLSTDTVEDKTTIQQMADDTAGLIKALGFDSVYALGWSMGARIAQQLAIRHPENVKKLILCAPNAGGTHQVPTSPNVLAQLNSGQDATALFFPNNSEGFAAAAEIKKRALEAVSNGTVPNDFSVSQQTIERQNLARGMRWDNSNDNYNALANIKIPVLVTDGKDDIIDPPGNVTIIANRIPFAWVAYFESGHAYLFQEAKRFAELVKVFLD